MDSTGIVSLHFQLLRIFTHHTSLKYRNQRIGIVYYLNPSQHEHASGNRMSPKRLSVPGKDNLVITTDVGPNYNPKLVQKLSKAYAHPIYSFKDSSASAWGIIDRAHGDPIDVAYFVFLLEMALPHQIVRKFRLSRLVTGICDFQGAISSERPSRRERHSLPSRDALSATVGRERLTQGHGPIRGQTLPAPVRLVNLDEIYNGLARTLADTQSMTRLLSCSKLKAPALLDTIQLVGRRSFMYGL